MVVYVDDMRTPAKLGRYPGKWSHLMVGPEDDIAELHEFAAKIGLRREWFQAHGWPRDHYDVPEWRRLEAIKAGAVAIGWRELGRMRLAAIEAKAKEMTET